MVAISGLNNALKGLQEQGTRVAKAANDINAALVQNQNLVAAATSNTAEAAAEANAANEAAVTDAVRGAVLPAEGDVTKPLVDLLQAATAYKANAVALRVTGDVERDVINILGNRKG